MEACVDILANCAIQPKNIVYLVLLQLTTNNELCKMTKWGCYIKLSRLERSNTMQIIFNQLNNNNDRLKLINNVIDEIFGRTLFGLQGLIVAVLNFRIEESVVQFI